MIRKKLQGYISSRPEQGNFTPQRVQNLVIREYCKKHNAEFILSATEYYMDNCYLMLEALIEGKGKINGVCFYNLAQLPSNIDKLEQTVGALLKEGIEVHFALEEIQLYKTEDMTVLRDLNLVAKLRQSDETIKLN